MQGTVVKRGRSWSYVVDLGRDPATGRRRQRWRGGFATRTEAARALRRELASVDSGVVAEAGRMTVSQYLDQWLDGIRPTIKPTTFKSYSEMVRWFIRPRLGAVL